MYVSLLTRWLISVPCVVASATCTCPGQQIGRKEGVGCILEFSLVKKMYFFFVWDLYLEFHGLLEGNYYIYRIYVY